MLRYFLLIAYLSCVILSADVKSTTGRIGFDVDSDGTFEMLLNASGLGVGMNQGSSSLEVQGTFGMGFQTISSNVTLGANSLVFLDTTNGDLNVSLPYAGNVIGRMYTLKKIHTSNTVTLSGGGNLIDDLSEINLNSDFGTFPSIDLVSNGVQWYIIRPSDYTAPVASDNLIGYWSMEDTSGNIILDETGGGQDATATGISVTDLKAFGQVGRSIRFSGDDDVLIPESPNPGFFHDEFTVSTLSLWCTVGAGGGGPRVLWEEGGTTNGQGIAYRTTPDTIVYATTQGGATVEIESTTTFAEDDSVWIHVAIVYDNGAMRLYINGSEEDSDTNGMSIPAHTDPPSMGNASSTTSSPFTNPTPWVGHLDEVRWYNKALDASEIQALYNRGL